MMAELEVVPGFENLVLDCLAAFFFSAIIDSILFGIVLLQVYYYWYVGDRSRKLHRDADQILYKQVHLWIHLLDDLWLSHCSSAPQYFEHCFIYIDNLPISHYKLQ